MYTPDDTGITATDEVGGAQKWRFELDPERFGAPSQLVHTAGQIIVAVDDSGVMPGADSTQIFVPDAATGTVVRDFDDNGTVTRSTGAQVLEPEHPRK